MKQDAGDGKMKEISDHIYEGALAFLNAEYKLLAIFVLIVSVLLTVVSFVVPTTHWLIVVAFIFGAIFSAYAGNIGMKIATKTNVRTTQAAKTSLPNALKISFGGGTVMGLGVAGLAVGQVPGDLDSVGRGGLARAGRRGRVVELDSPRLRCARRLDANRARSGDRSTRDWCSSCNAGDGARTCGAVACSSNPALGINRDVGQRVASSAYRSVGKVDAAARGDSPGQTRSTADACDCAGICGVSSSVR